MSRHSDTVTVTWERWRYMGFVHRRVSEPQLVAVAAQLSVELELELEWQ